MLPNNIRKIVNRVTISIVSLHLSKLIKQVKCEVSFDKIKLHKKRATGGVLQDICALVTFSKLE